MVTESSNNGPQEDEGEGDSGNISGSHTGCSRYARVDGGIEDYLRRKEEKRSGVIRKELGRRKGLGSGKGLKRTRLNPVSKKQSKKLREYKKAREEHYKDEKNQKCFLCGSTKNLSVHHSEGRGINISKEKSFVTLCIIGRSMDELYPDSIHSHSGGCHGWAHANASIARELGITI